MNNLLEVMMFQIRAHDAARVIRLLTAVGLILSPGFSRDGAAQQAGNFQMLPDVGFATTAADGIPVGIHYLASVGPTGGPYQPTEFFTGVSATEGEGTWAIRDNVFGVCFNLVNCSSQRFLPNLYDFSWTWEAGFKPSTSTPNTVENNIAVNYVDGTTHRPWTLDILTDQKAAVLNFSSTPNNVTFQINQNGNVVIGPPFRQPVKQLEVVGQALFTQSVDVLGNLTVTGLPVVTGSGNASFGPLQWGISDGTQVNSAGAICGQSRLGCQGGVLPNGTRLTCSNTEPRGVIFFALCQ
jgi:hypothetical protein